MPGSDFRSCGEIEEGGLNPKRVRKITPGIRSRATLLQFRLREMRGSFELSLRGFGTAVEGVASRGGLLFGRAS